MMINKSAINMKISDFADFTILELIILKSLLAHHKPIVRHSLYQEVNQIINPENKNTAKNLESNQNLNSEQLMLASLIPKKDLSTSSFYNSLQTLNQFGLIEFQLNNKGKIESLQATPKARNVLQIIASYFLQSIIQKNSVESAALSNCFKIIQKSDFSNILLISSKNLIEFNQISFLQKFTKEISILIFEDPLEGWDPKNLGFPTITRSILNKGRIREPDNLFELVVIPTVINQKEIPNISRMELIKELVRVTKPDGWIVMMAQSEAPKGDHDIANQILEAYNQIQNGEGLSITKTELQQTCESFGFKDFNIIERYGFLIAIISIKK